MRQPLVLSAYHALGGLAPCLWERLAAASHRKQGADPARLAERLGQASARCPDGPLIWVHAESVGELNGISSLLASLANAATLLVTTNTQTGAERAEALGLGGLVHQFKPVDTKRAARRFLGHWQPALALFAEADMPPALLRALSERGIPKALVAARPSKTRKRAPKIAKALLSQFDLITASSEPVAREIEALGLPVRVTEDLKAAQASAAAPPLDWPESQRARPLWLAVSTHPEDHALLFAAQDMILQAEPRALLAVAPRHPEPGRDWAADRFAPVFYSDSQPPRQATQLYVMDAFGHLPGLHAMSHVAYIGGALEGRGGHSPWEAARAGSVIMTGPNMANNAPAFAQVPHHVVKTAPELAEAVLKALKAPRPAPVLPKAQGATAKALRELLEGAI